MTTPVEDPFPIDVAGTTRVPFSRLVAVELRKMVDTRAGRWLIGITVGMLLLAMAVTLTVVLLNDFPLSLGVWMTILAIPLSLLMPTIAIISITQEWGQRTGLVTFALEPGRVRVVLAKLVCVLALALGTIVFAALMAVVGNLLFEGLSVRGAGWHIGGSELAWAVFLQLAYFVMAFGFGMVFLSTPGAIALYYVVSLLLPMMVYGVVMAVFSWAPDVVPWFDLGLAAAQFTSEAFPRSDFAELQLAFASCLWVVAPFVVGLWRVRRVELK